MADQRRMRCVWLAFIQQGLEPPRRPVEEERFDSGSHIILLPQRTRRNTEEDSGGSYTRSCAGFLRQNVSRECLPHPVLYRITR